MSLKSQLNQIIKERQGETVTLKELEDFCKKYPAKLSNAERRLRHSESPDIEAVYNEKHTAIIGYRFKRPEINYICCISWKIFQIHDRSCESLRVKAESSLF